MTIQKIIVTNDDGSTQEFDPAEAAAFVSNDRYFPTEIILAAKASHKKFWPRGPFVSVTLAQWALESGYGKAASGLNNYFGIKANADQIKAGQYTVRHTREETADGKSYTVDAKFANYASIGDCFDAHATLLTSKHYDACVQAQTPETYCAALKACGYATANNYVEALLTIMKVHNLKQYDERF